jgi:hypothetical protein
LDFLASLTGNSSLFSTFLGSASFFGSIFAATALTGGAIVDFNAFGAFATGTTGFDVF